MVRFLPSAYPSPLRVFRNSSLLAGDDVGVVGSNQPRRYDLPCGCASAIRGPAHAPAAAASATSNPRRFIWRGGEFGILKLLSLQPHVLHDLAVALRVLLHLLRKFR